MVYQYLKTIGCTLLLQMASSGTGYCFHNSFSFFIYELVSQAVWSYVLNVRVVVKGDGDDTGIAEDHATPPPHPPTYIKNLKEPLQMHNCYELFRDVWGASTWLVINFTDVGILVPCWVVEYMSPWAFCRCCMLIIETTHIQYYQIIQNVQLGSTECWIKMEN